MDTTISIRKKLYDILLTYKNYIKKEQYSGNPDKTLDYVDYIILLINTSNTINVNQNMLEQLTNRYIEAEQFLMELNWFERLLCSRKIIKFLKSRTVKYNF